MGVDIYVRCNCYEKNLCSEPPVDRNLIVLDEHDDSYEVNSENHDIHDLFYEWHKNCCEHERMHYLDTKCLNNYSVVSRLACFLIELGDNFNFTYKALRIVDGSIKAEISKIVLNELEKINSIEDIKNLAIKYHVENDKYSDGKLYSEYYGAFFETIETLKEGCQASIETGNSLVFV